MKRLRALVRKLRRSSSAGQTVTEYALVISVLSIAMVASTEVFVTTFSTAMEELSTDLASGLTEAGIRP